MINYIKAIFFVLIGFIRIDSVICQMPIVSEPIDAAARILVNLESRPLEISITRNCNFHNLKPGFNYKSIATEIGTPYNIIPCNGEEQFEPARIEIDGNPFSAVIVSFQLVGKIYNNENEWDFISMGYDNNSASVVDESTGNYHFFNPLNGTLLHLPENGKKAVIYLGGNPMVPSNAPAGIYTGEEIITVSYTGNSI
jgi:hypothetical protein